jgi:hypothetical protein
LQSLFVVIILPATKFGGGGILNSACPSAHPCSVFLTFFELNMQVLKWNLVWLFTIMSYRSSLSYIIIDQYLSELWFGIAPDLKFSWTFLSFRTFLKLILQILKWNSVWFFTIMSYGSLLSFVVIDQYLTELWPLDFLISLRSSLLRGVF